jgi:cadmium resistance protein CadD (predicted permease)
MDHLLSLIGIGIVTFVSTNIDDLVMLIALFAERSYRPAHIVIG